MVPLERSPGGPRLRSNAGLRVRDGLPRPSVSEDSWVTLPREEVESVTHGRSGVADLSPEDQRLDDVLAGLEHAIGQENVSSLSEVTRRDRRCGNGVG